MVEHLVCTSCGLRSLWKDGSSCPSSSARLLKLHDWQDAFELARDAGVLVWEYESRREFELAERAMRDSGWTAGQVEETRRGIGRGKRGFPGPASFLMRRKGIVVTFRLRERRVFRDWTTDALLQPRMRSSGPPVGNRDGNDSANGSHENGQSIAYDGDGALLGERDQSGDDHTDVYDVDGMPINGKDRSE